MAELDERNFHILMGGLLLTSILLDPAIRSIKPDWRPLEVSWITFAVGLAWLGRYSTWRTQHAQRELRALRDRVDALEDQRRRDDAKAAAMRRPHDGPWP